MMDGSAPKGSLELGALLIIGALATAVRMADDRPKTLAILAWNIVVGLGLATGGWLLAKAGGLDGWPALAAAWVAGAVGSEAILPMVRRALDKRSGA
jgi:hypothetical protein